MTWDLAIFLDMTARAQAAKGKTEKLGFPKMKIFSSYDQGNEKATHRMGRILANHISDKRLTSRIYKEL